jgi:hypothetical protein
MITVVLHMRTKHYNQLSMIKDTSTPTINLRSGEVLHADISDVVEYQACDKTTRSLLSFL